MAAQEAMSMCDPLEETFLPRVLLLAEEASKSVLMLSLIKCS